MTGYRRGDVILVRFPFTSAAASKQRPALVVSSNMYNRVSPDLMIVSITSHLDAVSHPGDHRFSDWRAAGLLKPSLAQMKIATVEQSIIVRRLGQLTEDDLDAVDRGLREALDLSEAGTDIELLDAKPTE